MDRRALLRVMALVATGGLAGCSGGGDDGTATPAATGSPTSSPMASSTPTDTSTPSATATPTRTPTATSTRTNTPAPTATPSPTATPTRTPTPVDAAVTVEVGPNGQFRFAPKSFEVAAGETVRWVWRGGGHNVKPTSTPRNSDWTGTPGGDSETFAPGHVYTHTFETTGTYEYHCVPHRSLGMTGSFTVA